MKIFFKEDFFSKRKITGFSVEELANLLDKLDTVALLINVVGDLGVGIVSLGEPIAKFEKSTGFRRPVRSWGDGSFPWRLDGGIRVLA